MAGLLGGDDPQGGLLGIDPYSLAIIAQLFSAKKGDNYGLNIANIESQRQAAMNRAQQAQLMKFQINQAQRAEQDDLAARKTIQDYYANQQNPQAGPPVPVGAPGGGTTLAPAGQPAAPTQASGGKFDTFNRYNALADQLERSGNLPQSKLYRDLAEKFRPELKDTKTLTDPQSGQRVTVNFYKDGTREVVPFAPDKEKLHFMDTGGAVQGMDAFSGAPVGQPMAKTQSPDSIASNAVAKRGQNMTDARERISIAYNTGFGAQQYGMQVPQIPGVNTQGMTPHTANTVAVDVGKKQGEAVQQARLQLPAVEASTKQTIDLVDKLLTHPGFSTTVGMKGPTGAFAAAGYPIPGTDAADFVTLQHQVVGKQFLQAYETLKGAGQITEVEGKKATSAIAAMDNAQSEAAYRAAARDFQSTMKGALQRMQSRAAGNVGGSSQWSIRPLD